MYKTLTFFFILFFCMGCAADRHAQQLALQVIQTTVKYEAEVDKKVAAEKAFYRDQQALIHSALVGKSKISSNDPENTDIQKTLIYGRLRTSAERDARLTAEQIVSSEPPRIFGYVIDYIVKGVEDDKTFYLNIIDHQRRLTGDLLTNLEKIDQQKAKLKSARSHLTTLATQLDVSTQINQIIEFGKAVDEEIKKEKKEK